MVSSQFENVQSSTTENDRNTWNPGNSKTAAGDLNEQVAGYADLR